MASSVFGVGNHIRAVCGSVPQVLQKYKPQPKPEKRNHWGSKLLAKLRARGKPTKTSPGQKSLWEEWDAPTEEIRKVAEKFVLANCFDPNYASQQFISQENNNTG